jgi:hypothetical protein
MIVNDKNEVKECRLLPRDIRLEALFFLPCQSIKLFSVSLYHNQERNGMERNGLDLKTDFSTLMEKNDQLLLNLFLFR